MSKSPNKGKKGSAGNKKQNQGNATAKKAMSSITSFCRHSSPS